MSSSLYQTRPWRELRSRVSEDANCVLANLAGPCQGSLVLHHIVPVSEGGPEIPSEDGVAWLCKRHHSAVHSWLKRREPQWKTCSHNHRYPWAKTECERRLNAA